MWLCPAHSVRERVAAEAEAAAEAEPLTKYLRKGSKRAHDDVRFVARAAPPAASAAASRPIAARQAVSAYKLLLAVA